MAELLKLESSIESGFVNWASKQKFEAIKINKRGWPDRLVVLNSGYCFYIEFKRCMKTSGLRQGEKYQNYIHKLLRSRGFHVYLLDTKEEARRVFEYELDWSNNIMKMYKPFKELSL